LNEKLKEKGRGKPFPPPPPILLYYFFLIKKNIDLDVKKKPQRRHIG
jgi:hypothetical protein